MADHPSTRARDADRDAAIEVVEAAYADGQLSDADRDLRVERLLRAGTLGDVETYVRDLQGRPEPVHPQRPRRGRRPKRQPRQRHHIGLAAALVGLVVALLAGTGTFFLATVGTVTQSATTGPDFGDVPGVSKQVDRVEPPDMFTREELVAFLTAVEEKSASGTVSDLSIYEDYAFANIPTGRRRDTWRYADYQWRGDGLVATGGVGATDDPPFEVGRLKATLLLDLHRRSVKLVDEPTRRYELVRRDPMTTQGQPIVSAYAGDGTGYLAASLRGRVLRIHAP